MFLLTTFRDERDVQFMLLASVTTKEVEGPVVKPLELESLWFES